MKVCARGASSLSSKTCRHCFHSCIHVLHCFWRHPVSKLYLWCFPWSPLQFFGTTWHNYRAQVVCARPPASMRASAAWHLALDTGSVIYSCRSMQCLIRQDMSPHRCCGALKGVFTSALHAFLSACYIHRLWCAGARRCWRCRA